MEIMDDPYPETPGQREDEVAKVVAFFQSSSEIPADLKPELIKKASAFVESHTVQSGHHHYGGQLGWTRWIVRNDQLNLVSSLAPGAIGIATYATAAASAANPVVLAVTLLFSGLAIGSRLKDKAAIVETGDYQVLMTLKQIGPTTPIALTNFLNGVKIFGSGQWKEERVLEILRKFKAFAVRDGSVEEFVQETADGRFSTNGI
jgi:hypothetical protein